MSEYIFNPNIRAEYCNPIYICEDCGRNLGDRYSHIKGKKQPCVNKIKGHIYCDKCADKYYDKQMKG